jgi:exopolyphosphatase / guanosine-5'-triphosphate,3'-diphosphate pyrophosphatase
MTAPVAAIDCGTNSTRLLITSAAGETLDRRMTITRMGDGVDRHHRLTSDAIGRTVGALAEYAQAMATHGVGRRRAVATSAARDADNREEFFAAAESVIGVRPELLSGTEEGRLSYLGATAELDPGDGAFLALDIGGGSTELAVAGAAISLDMGCVRLSERFFLDDPPAPGQMSAARAEITYQLDRARRHLADQPSARSLIGLAGTVSTASMIDAGIESYSRQAVHHRRLQRDSLRSILEWMAGLDHHGRSGVPGLEPGRVDVIVGGMLILLSVMEDFGFGSCLVSESDILDGIVAGLLEAGSR